MKNKNCRPKQSTNLRRQAEKTAQERLLQSSVSIEAMSLEETRLMLHELQVHQIELEMQNEELRRIQEELNVAQECYFDLYNMAPAGYVISDRDGRIVQANLTTATLLGIVRESLVNQSLTRFILTEDQDIYYHHRKKVFKNGDSQVCDLRMVKADGTAFWASLITKVVEQEGDSPLYRIILTDISERKRSEETISRSEERYQAIINASPLAIFLVRNGRYLYANPAARKMLGYPLDCDISTVSIDQTITPAQLTHIRRRISAVETGLANPPIELTIIKADGSSTVTESISIPIQLEDGPAVLAMGIDINDRKKSADLLKARIRLSEASFFLDLNSLLTMALDEVEILTGSQIGFFHLFDEDQKTISLHAWSTSTVQSFCKTKGAGSHYQIEIAGVWADCIRERKTIVHNDFAGLPHRKGLPNGHAVIMRELVVPVFRNERIVAILGVGNKTEEYNDKDIDLVSNLANMAWDIFLRKQAEVALRESEEKHRFLIEKSHDIIYTLNADGQLTFISPSWTNLLGHPVNQVVDKSFDTFIHPEDHAAWLAWYQEVRMTEKCQEGIEYRMRHVDGSWHWHTSNIVPLWNEAGVIVGIEGIARDITDRKRVETVVRESEAKYRSAFTLMRLLCDNVPDMIWAKDMEKRYIFVNKAICRNLLNAADTDEPIGKTDMFFAERERTRHADNPRWHTFGEICRDSDAITMDACTPQQFDEYGNVQGEFLCLDVHKAPFLDANDKIIGTVGSARDVTAAKIMMQKLRDSEERFRLLYDSSFDGILLTIPDGRIIAANRSSCRLLQRTEEEIKQIGRNGILDTSDPRLDLFLEERDRTGKSHCELTFIGKNGAKFPVEVSSSIYQDKDGNVIASVIFRDITERKKAEDALRLSEERFRRLFAQNCATTLMIDPYSGEIIEANQAAANFYGWSIEELKQMRIQEINTLSSENVKSLMEKTRLSGSLGLEFRHRRADGSIRDVEVFSSRIEMTEKVFLYSIIHDITDRKHAEEALQASIAEKEVLLREVHHRVKNNMAAIIGLFNLQRQAMDDPQVQTVLTELSSRVRAMSLVHEKLYRSNSVARIDFQDYIQSLTSHLRTSFGSPSIHCEIESAGVKMPLDLAVPCGMIINELITNALKYAFPAERSGASDRIDRILIAMSHDKDIFNLSVADNGVGLPPGFDLNEAKTLGLVLVRMLGRHQLGGQYKIDQIGGTRFTLTFPHHGRKTH